MKVAMATVLEVMMVDGSDRGVLMDRAVSLIASNILKELVFFS